jgi:hypothetical protein
MRRVTQDELDFYDGLADRINRSLSHPGRELTQTALASRIGWHRAGLCNFLNRTDKTIAAHLIPRIARTVGLSIDELIGGAATGAAERTSWDPRADDAECFVEKLYEWRRRNLPNIRLHGHFPPLLLPRRGMIANYVNSVFDGCCARAAERWHDLIDAHRELIEREGEGDFVNLILFGDLLGLPGRQFPFERFSREEVIHTLETVKRDWVRHRGFVLIAVDDAALTPDERLQLSSSTSIGVVGHQTRVEYGSDFRVRWSEDPEVARRTNECLLRLKKSAGFGPRERPTTQEVERLIDGMLVRLDDHPSVHIACGPRARRPAA